MNPKNKSKKIAASNYCDAASLLIYSTKEVLKQSDRHEIRMQHLIRGGMAIKRPRCDPDSLSRTNIEDNIGHAKSFIKERKSSNDLSCPSAYEKASSAYASAVAMASCFSGNYNSLNNYYSRGMCSVVLSEIDNLLVYLKGIASGKGQCSAKTKATRAVESLESLRTYAIQDNCYINDVISTDSYKIVNDYIACLNRSSYAGRFSGTGRLRGSNIYKLLVNYANEIVDAEFVDAEFDES